MAAENSKKKFQDEVTCPICLGFFTNPVILDCGHSFCQICILGCWEEAGTNLSCPQCRRTVGRNFRPNRSLSNLVEILNEWRDPVVKATEEKPVLCEDHQHPLTLFCNDDQTALCVECEKSYRHNGHTVVSAKEAVREYKEELHKCLKTLGEQKMKILTYKRNLECQTQYMTNVTNTEKRKIVAQFTQLRQFAEAQEGFLRGRMEEVENELTRMKDELFASISEDLSCLETFIQEMEEKTHLTADELLEDDRSILQVYALRQMIHIPEVYPDELKWRVWNFCDISPCLDAAMQQLRETVHFELILRKVFINLDPDTAHSRLIVAESLQCVQYGETSQELPDNPRRFDKLTAVLGCEEFIAGRYTWEVTVGAEGNWAVGVAKKSVRRKGYISLSSGEEVWCFGKWEGHYRTTDHYCVFIDPSKEPRKIRVTLNCTGRRLAFFNCDHAGPITTFSLASDSEEAFVPFFWVDEKAHLELAS